MTDNIIQFPNSLFYSRHPQDESIGRENPKSLDDIDPAVVLENAKGLHNILVLGYDEDGQEYFGSSTGYGPQMLWLLERMKLLILDNAE